jgi:hypothetical protein
MERAGTGTRWEAQCGAVFDLKSNYRRPEGWTSADAAGLALFPGLVRYDEVVDAAPIRTRFASRCARATGTFGPHRTMPAAHPGRRRWAHACVSKRQRTSAVIRRRPQDLPRP